MAQLFLCVLHLQPAKVSMLKCEQLRKRAKNKKKTIASYIRITHNLYAIFRREIK